MANAFDVVVIGGGPGGYVAAIRAAQLGLKTACVDDWKNAKGKPSLGGTCVNVGCIPSKALLESSENYERAAHKFAAHGIRIDNVSIDVAAMLARKNKIVDTLTAGVASLFKKNKVTLFPGLGRFVSGGDRYRIEVRSGEQTETLEAAHVIVATGSVPRPLPGVAIDNEFITDNVGALQFPEVPKRLAVIGAGVIGLEMGSVWRRLGSEVTLLEALPGFLMAADNDVAKEAQKIFFREAGFKLITGIKIAEVAKTGNEVRIKYSVQGKEQSQGQEQVQAQELVVDKLIVAVGRAPNTDGLGADAVGLQIDARGFVEVDAECRANLPNVYAIGDVVRGPMLAHKASEEGVMVAELIAGQKPHVNLDTIPWVIYTSPEIAWVGKTEQELKAQDTQYRAGRFPFLANGRAKALGETVGFVKILADAKSDRILGMHIIGPFASEMIAEAVVAMEFSASSEDIARIVHAHPSLSEVMHEAALAVDARALHI